MISLIICGLFLSLRNLMFSPFSLFFKLSLFDNGPFRNYCATHGISFRLSCPYTSSQNGKAERKIRTINNMIRTLMTHASIPPSFWHHALAMPTYLLNILPSKVLDSQSPLQILYHRDPRYSHLRVFGCLCYPLFPSTTIHKLQPRSTPCVFLGYPSNYRGYKCYDISSRKIIISRHVMFDETRFPFSKLHTPPKSTYDFLDDGVSPYVVHHLASQNCPLPTPGSQPLGLPEQPTHLDTAPPAHLVSPTPLSPTGPRVPAGPLPTTTDLASSLTQPAPQIPPSLAQPPAQPGPSPSPSITHGLVTRSQRGVFKPKRHFNLSTILSRSPLPKNPVLALRDPNRKMAMDAKFNALIDNKTWELVPRPPDVNVIRSMWIFAHKERSDGSFERHKARLVGDGKTQQVGVDCGETFRPVVKPLPSARFSV